MELIGKQIAIETILGQPPELHYPSWYAAQIEKLPPAPPEYLAEQAGILVTDTDTISRQAAIDGKICIQRANGVEIYDDYAVPVEYLEQLPPIQPKTGRWILDRSGAYCCSECMEPCATYVMMKPRDKFCKMCGSRNEASDGND